MRYDARYLARHPVTLRQQQEIKALERLGYRYYPCGPDGLPRMRFKNESGHMLLKIAPDGTHKVIGSTPPTKRPAPLSP